MWDLRNGESIQTLAIPSKRPVRLLFDRAEARLTCIDEDGDVFEANVESGDVRRIGKTALPEVPVESIVKNTAVHSTIVCSINASGEIVVPRPKDRPVMAAAPRAPYVSIPVFVATNRARSSPPTFFGGCLHFFAGILGLISLVIATVVCGMCAFVRGKKTLWLATGISFAVLFVLAGGAAMAEKRGYDPAMKDMFEPSVGDMTYGVCTVTVPTSGRRKGQLNSPLKVWVFEATADPSLHITLQQSDVLKKDDLFEKIKQRVTDVPRKEAFIFIHGYNVTFEDSVRRTAQLAYDLAFPGAPICFSWPSFGLEAAYFYDARNAEDSVPQLQQFLKDVATKSGATRVHVIAHSMGNRVLSQAIETEPGVFHEPASVFRHLVLAAPDVDKDLFARRIAPKLVTCKQAITLYASSHDRALALSKIFNGQPRAGDTRPEIMCFRGIDSIDCSEASSGGLGHSYISDEPAVLSDLFYLLTDKPAGERFGVESATQGTDNYWRIRQ
jgi:esterase/lipase superfamily enzyme